ncbi:MAG: F420-dependent NADP oxidoreductase [Acidobacteria bacterium]|nr:F420-dependent NADP oxidoreductase [Acidobacteriota bacterium]
MKIAIIGSGNVGAALGAHWAAAGRSVVFGVRNPAAEKAQAAVAKAPGSRAATVAEAAAEAEVVVLTTPWGDATKEALDACGDLAGKIILDCTNPVNQTFDGLSLGLTTSAGEQVQAWAPQAKVVKIFNTTGSNNMENPDYGGRGATMLYCGDDPVAKETAATLAAEIGFEPADVGPLTQSRFLEPLAMLWISMALRYGYGREIAFQLLRR